MHTQCKIRASYCLQTFKLDEKSQIRVVLLACHVSVQVLELDPADVRLLAPVLQSPALRQVLTCLSKDVNSGTADSSNARSKQAPAFVPSVLGTGTAPTASAQLTGLKLWMANPRVLHLLRQAAKALRLGQITEEQLVQALLQLNQVCSNTMAWQAVWP